MPEISETLKGSFTKFFGTVRQKIFDGNLWYPYYAWNFSIPQIFWNIEGMPTKFFIHKTFWNKNFLKNSRIPLRKFSALWDIKNSTENRDMPPLIHNFFRYQKISGEQKGSFTKLFVSVLWDKKFRQNRDAPRPSYAWKFSIKEFFWNNTKVFSNETFRYSETKTSTENLDTPHPPLIQTFSVPEISETLKSSPLRKFSALWDKKFPTENLETPPPPPPTSYPNFFDARN